VFFGTIQQRGNYRITLLLARSLFLPAALFAWFLRELHNAAPTAS
jgi:hypothetical protein